MYSTLIFIHSWNRWLVLLTFAIALISLSRGRIQSFPQITKIEKIGLKSFLGLLDLQFLLGLGLLWITPLIAGGHIHPWIYHHAGGMLIGVACAHASNSIGKKKPTVEQQRKVYLVGNIIAFIVMFGSIPWPFMSFARPLFRGL